MHSLLLETLRMYSYFRTGPAWWMARLYGCDSSRSRWLAAARRGGHRLFEMEDEEGQQVTVVVVHEQRQLAELCRLMETIGIHGTLEPMP